MTLVITGGSRGIGRNIVISAARAGWDVAFTYKTASDEAAIVCREVAQIAPDRRCNAYQLDVRSSVSVATVCDQIADDFGTIKAVVNNAGIHHNNLLFTMSDNEWTDVLDTNLSGAFYIIRQFLPVFLAQKKGRFISISSVASGGMTGQGNYSASKAGLLGLSATVAKEYGSKGITSNVVSPGFFETDMTAQGMRDTTKILWNQLCPMKRMGKLDELSSVVLFLASDDASFVNGQVISVSGGLEWTP